MGSDEWNTAVRSKTSTSWNLHSVLGPELDFFVLLSSTVGLTGNPEQSNYAAGGTFQDSLARYLSSQGHPVVSMDLPVILGVGFVAEKQELLDYMRSTGWAYMEEARVPCLRWIIIAGRRARNLYSWFVRRLYRSSGCRKRPLLRDTHCRRGGSSLCSAT